MRALLYSYYEEQLSPITDTGVWKIKSVLKERKIKGRKQSLVEWLGFPISQASWVDNSQLTEVFGSKKKK